MNKRTSRVPDDERRVDLKLWFQNGSGMPHAGEGKGLPEVSIGRTNSERGIGFIVFGNWKKLKTVTIGGEEETCFVLDRTQVENLHAYLGGQIERLKPMRWPQVLSLPALAKRSKRQQAAALGRRRARQRARRRAQTMAGAR
jgi:hypothetical protein